MLLLNIPNYRLFCVEIHLKLITFCSKYCEISRSVTGTLVMVCLKGVHWLFNLRPGIMGCIIRFTDPTFYCYKYRPGKNWRSVFVSRCQDMPMIEIKGTKKKVRVVFGYFKSIYPVLIRLRQYASLSPLKQTRLFPG